ELATTQLQNRNPEWAWRFLLLDARVLLREGKNNEVLAMLSQPLPSSLTASDIALERTVLQAWAYTSLGRSDEARQALQLVQSLSNRVQSPSDSYPTPLRVQAFNTWGLICVQLADLIRADEIFHRNLEFAHKQNDQYQLARTLLNLSVVALKRERFDEALDRSEAAVHAAKKIEARTLLEKSQGNIAWANYKLGNFEEALEGFRTAAEGAKTVEEASDRMEWLNDIGLSLYRLGHLQEAETYYKNALQIA